MAGATDAGRLGETGEGGAAGDAAAAVLGAIARAAAAVRRCLHRRRHVTAVGGMHVKSRIILAVAAVLGIALAIAPAASKNTVRKRRRPWPVAARAEPHPAADPVGVRLVRSRNRGAQDPGQGPGPGRSFRLSASATARPAVPGGPWVERQGQPELPEPHRPRPAGPRAGAERDLDRAGPQQPAATSSPSSNDYRRGDGNCYTYYSGDGGRSWQDSTPADGLHPRRRPSVASRASTGRPAATPRSRGTLRATRTCRARCSTAGRGLEQPGQSSAFYVFRSTGTGGASWNFPAVRCRAQRHRGHRRCRCSTSST